MKHWSYYNIYKDTPKGNKLIFNTCSGGIYLLDAKDKANIDKDVSKLKSFSKLGELESEQYIVDFDEKEMVEYQFNKSKFNNNVLGLTICPTMKCNLSCTYCYENRKQGDMTDETIKNLVAFIDDHTKPEGRLSITWYGGEPLFHLNKLKQINDAITPLIKAKKLNYDAYMITNATLINDDIIKFLKEIKIHSLQVTLDGPKQMHDQRRIYQNGRGTYDQIIRSLKMLNKAGIQVHLRINVDKYSIAHLDELLDDLVKNDIKVEVYLGHIQANTDACKSNGGVCLTKSEFDLINYKFIKEKSVKYAGQLTFSDLIQGKKLLFCGAQKENSFVIDSEGYVYKCWNEVGNPKVAVKNLNDGVDNIKNTLEYYSNSPFKTFCRDCKYLPLCMGGCPYNKRREKVCTNYMKVIDKYLNDLIMEKNL